MRAPSRRSALVAAFALATSALAAAALSATPAIAAPSAVDALSAHHGHKVTHPTVGAAKSSRAAANAPAKAASQLVYRGGVHGIGVTTGPPKVYLVFWGSQWGTAGTDANTNLTLTGDTSGVAPVLQQMFKGLGTGGETWSGVMSQYCETTTGATTCPASAVHVGIPSGGALAGVWYDNASATGSQTSDREIAVEAVAAATHFGTTALSNRNAQYVIVSPTGTHPNGFNTTAANWCAWHDWNGDTTLTGGAVTSTVGDIAFTNLPYLPDMGASCGANYVNAGTAGLLDGVTMVEGHEYSETITDQNPAGGWTDSSGAENADKCTWIGTGGTGGSQNVTFGTGTFAMQGTWSNDSANCRIAHPNVVTNGNVVTVTVPVSQTTLQGTTATPVTATATDTGVTASYTWTATGLPTGITIGSSTGTLSGKPTAKGTFTVKVTATDSSSATGTASFTWTVTGTTVAVATIATQSTTRSTTAASVAPVATDSNSAITTFTWSATGLPSGITINSSTGVMSGKVSSTLRTYTVKVTAKDSNSSTGSTTFSWTVK